MSGAIITGFVLLWLLQAQGGLAIYRSTCHLTGTFDYFQKGGNTHSYYRVSRSAEMALFGHMIDTILVQDELECGIKCLQNARCLSFNYEHVDVERHVCELCDATREMAPIAYKTRSNFTHFHPEDTVTRGPGCTPDLCVNGGTCVDTCSRELFKCNCIKPYSGKYCEKLPPDCQGYLSQGATQDGIYVIDPEGQGKRSVYCDQTTDGGGWTVFQRRFTPFREYFNRTWPEYELGFGNVSGEFWLGNEVIHSLTAKSNVTLRIELKESGGNAGYAVYKRFQVSSSAEKYRLAVGNYSAGNICNALYGYGDGISNHDGMQFTTRDQDNDLNGYGLCHENSGWWLNNCGHGDLNQMSRPQWDEWSFLATITYSEMKLR